MRPIQKPKIFNAFMKNRIEIKKVKIRNVEIIQYIINGHLRNYAENLEKIEPKTLDWIDNFEKNSVFYDVGALSGPFSIYAALKTGVKVVAFEPEAQNFAALEMNHYLNRKRITHPIISLNIALSNLNELGKLYMSRNDLVVEPFLKSCNVILIDSYPLNRMVIGGTKGLCISKLKKLNPKVKVVVYFGKVDNKTLIKSGITCYPEKDPGLGRMNWTADILGSKVIIELNALGLKVGELLAFYRKSGLKQREAELIALEHPFCADFSKEQRKNF